MDSHDASTSDLSGQASDPALDQFVDGLLDRLQRGEAVDVQAEIVAHPEWARQLLDIFPGLMMLGVGRGSARPTLSSQSAAPTPSSLFDISFSDYRLLREIGRGGMGVVYEAEQVSLRRRVAIKVFPRARQMGPRQLQRFLNEARTAASLEHPHVVPVFGVGAERGEHFFAMQFIDGENWAQSLATRRESAKGTLPVDQCEADKAAGGREPSPIQKRSSEEHSIDEIRSIVRHAIDVASALHYAHQLGVVHRDIKPSNLILDSSGKIWLADFGLAQVDSETHLTHTNEMVGTLRYMSPEQIDATRAACDHRVDIYSLGATLYEMLTLRPVFSGTTNADLMRQILETNPVVPRTWNPVISPDLEAILLKSLEANPIDRYTTALEFADDLRRWLDGRPVVARRPTSLESAAKWIRRNTSFVVAACVTLLVVSVISIGAAFAVWRENVRATQALVTAENKTHDANLQTARLALERGLRHCDANEIAEGLNWFCYALQRCPADERDDEHLIRANLDAWRSNIHSLAMVLRHDSLVIKVAFGADGRHLITSAQDGQLHVWNTDEKRLSRRIAIAAPLRTNLPFAIHPQRDWVVVGDPHGRIHVVDFSSGESVYPPRELPLVDGRRSSVVRVALDDRGEQILVCDSLGNCQVWPLVGENAISPLMHHAKTPADCLFTPDGTGVVTVLDHGPVRSWKLPGGEPLEDLFQIRDDVAFELAWRNAGRELLFAGQSFGATSWNVSNKTLAPQKFPHLARVQAVASCDARRLVATGSFDQTARIWHGDTGKLVGPPLHHPCEITGVVFDQKGERLVTAAGTELRVWNLANPEPRTFTPLDISRTQRQLGLNDDGKTVFSRDKDDRLQGWRIADGQRLNLSIGNVEDFRISPDGTQMIWTEKGYVHVTLTSGKELWSAQISDVDVGFTDDGKHVIAASSNRLLILNAVTGELIHTLRGERSRPVIAACDAGLSTCIAGDFNGRLQAWRIADGDNPIVTREMRSAVSDVRLAPNRAEFEIGLSNSEIHFIDAHLLSESRPKIVLPRKYKQMSFVVNHEFTLGVAGDGTARFFDLASGNRVGSEMVHYGAQRKVGYSGGGAILATNGPDGDVRLWRVPDVDRRGVAEIQSDIEFATGLKLTERGEINDASPSP